LPAGAPLTCRETVSGTLVPAWTAVPGAGEAGDNSKRFTLTVKVAVTVGSSARAAVTVTTVLPGDGSPAVTTLVASL
jgi:hypothetical protein